jgi:Transglutaminase-like superfamily
MRFLSLEALWLLVVYDIVLRAGKLSGLHRRIRQVKVGPPPTVFDMEARVAHAISIVCVWYPRHVKCLQRAAAMTELMRRCGVSAEFVIGTVKHPLEFHAWVEVDGRAVAEKHDTQSIYAVLERC